MTLHHHILTGCAPTPLAHYLKALGILRTMTKLTKLHDLLPVNGAAN